VLLLALVILAATACSSSAKEEGVSPQVTPSPTASVSASASDPDTSASPEASSSPGEQSPSATSEPSPSDDSPSASPSEHAEHEMAMPSESPSATPSEKPSASPSQGNDDKAEVVVVEIKDFAFSPSKVTIRKGDTVQFVNRDKIKHTATADDGGFDTGLLGQDVSKDVVFKDEGTFTFFCTPHPGMTGTIVVEKD
jgi:plastocyanin